MPSTSRIALKRTSKNTGSSFINFHIRRHEEHLWCHIEVLSGKQRLIIDLQAVCDAYVMYDISNDGFASSRNHTADGLTKIGKCGAFYPFFRLTNVILSQNKGLFVSGVQPQQPTICLLHPFAMLVHKSKKLYTHLDVPPLHTCTWNNMQVYKLYWWK